MIIKISNQLLHSQQTTNFEYINSNNIPNQPTFHGKFHPPVNYFTILHHIISKNTPVKQIFKQFNQHLSQRCIVNNQTKSNNDQNNQISDKIKSLENKSQLANTQVSQSFRSSHRPNWKDSILRRKNNGVNGQIIKGKSQSHYSCIISRLQNQCQESPKPPQDSRQTKFSPLGKLYPKNTCLSFQQRRKRLQQVLNGQSYNFPAQRIKLDQKFKKKKRKRKVSIKFDSNYLNKTCIPLNSSLERILLPSEAKRTVKSISQKPIICMPRGFTPRPWQTVQPS